MDHQYSQSVYANLVSTLEEKNKGGNDMLERVTHGLRWRGSFKKLDQIQWVQNNVHR